MEPALRLHIKQLVLRVCDVQDIEPASLADDGGLFGVPPAFLTSLDAVEIAVALEHEFKFRVQNASSVRSYFHSIAGMASFVRDHAQPDAVLGALGMRSAPTPPS